MLKRYEYENEKRLALGADYLGNEYGLVFTDEVGRWIEPDRMTRTFQREAERLDLPKIGPHGLRHSVGTNGMRQRLNPKVVADRLGHSSVQTTLDRYTHPDEAARREAAEFGASMIGGGA